MQNYRVRDISKTYDVYMKADNIDNLRKKLIVKAGKNYTDYEISVELKSHKLKFLGTLNVWPGVNRYANWQQAGKRSWQNVSYKTGKILR